MFALANLCVVLAMMFYAFQYPLPSLLFAVIALLLAMRTNETR
jgi:hypothetical protein